MPPRQRVGRMAVQEVPDAFVTRVRRGTLRTLDRPDRWLCGAVHDGAGRLVVASQKIGGLGGNQAVMADPARVRTARPARRLQGTWLYGGHWIQHFGHFVTETVTTLWPGSEVRRRVDGIVFHSYMSPFRGVSPWQSELMSHTAYAGLPVEIVEGDPLRVDRLLVPTRSVVVNGWAEPQAVEVWDRMTRDAGGRTELDTSGPGLFLSRTAFNAGRRAAGKTVRTSVERDRALDAAFAESGFEVLSPETLPVAEQLRLVSGASVLAGSAGTALHLSAFAPAGVRVVELGDDRSPAVQVPHQLVIDAARRHPSAFIPRHVPARRVPGMLAALGLR